MRRVIDEGDVRPVCSGDASSSEEELGRLEPAISARFEWPEPILWEQNERAKRTGAPVIAAVAESNNCPIRQMPRNGRDYSKIERFLEGPRILSHFGMQRPSMQDHSIGRSKVGQCLSLPETSQSAIEDWSLFGVDHWTPFFRPLGGHFNYGCQGRGPRACHAHSGKWA